MNEFKALHAILKKYQKLIDQNHDLIWEVDTEDRYIYVNARSADIFGYTPEELIGRKCMDYALPGEAEKIAALFENMDANPETIRNFIVHFYRKDGSVVILESNMVVVYDEDGNWTGYFGISRDITQRAEQIKILERHFSVEKQFAELTHVLFHTSPSDKDFTSLIHHYALQLTNSPHGFVSVLDPLTRNMISHTLTMMMGNDCKLEGEDARIVFAPNPDGTYPGLWGYALNQKKGFYTNHPDQHPASKGLPAGHIPLRNFLAVPAMEGQECIGLIAVANADVYTDDDLNLIQRLADLYALALTRNRKERELTNIQLQLRNLYNAMLDGFALHEMVYDEQSRPVDYRFILVNPAFEEITGLIAGDIIGKTVKEVLPATEDYWIETYGRVALTGEPTRFINFSAALNKYFEVMAYCPEKNFFATIFRDVTIEIVYEETLRASEERYRNLFNNSAIAIAIRTPEGRLVDCNMAYCQMLGYTKEELFCLTTDDLTVQNDLQLTHDHLKKIAEGRSDSERYEKRYYHKNGHIVWGEVSIRPLQDEEGKITAIIGAVNDITLRKQMEEELRRSHERYKSFIEQTREAIYCTEFDEPIDITLSIEEQIDAIYAHAYIGECNLAMARMYGFSSPDDFKGQRLIDRHGGAHHPRNREAFRRFIESGYQGINELTEEIDVHGQIHYFLNNATGIIENGKLVRIWGTATDITELKKAETQIRNSQAQLTLITDALPFQLAHIGSDLKYLYVNKAHAGWFGKTKDQMIGQDIHSYYSGIVSEKIRPYIRKVLKGEKITFEFQTNNLQGKEVYLRGEFIPHIDPDGIQRSFFAFFEDITDKITEHIEKSERLNRVARQQSALAEIARLNIAIARDRNLLMRQITEIVADALEVSTCSIWMGTHQLGYIDCVDKYHRDFKNHDNHQRLLISNYPTYFRELERSRYIDATDASNDLRTREFTKDYFQPLGIASTLDVPLYIAGEFFGIICCEQKDYHRAWKQDEIDFTVDVGNLLVNLLLNIERQEALEHLLISEKKFHTLFENSIDAILIADKDGNYKEVNPAACELFKIDRHQFLQMNVRDIRKPDGTDLGEHYKQFVQTGHEKGEISFLCSDGKVRTAEYSAFYLREGLYASVLRDVTERRLYEIKLRESEQKFSRLFLGSPDVITITEFDTGQLIDVNNTFCRITGYSREEALKKTTLDLQLWISSQDRKRFLEELTLHGNIREREMQFRMRSGEIRYFLFNAEIVELNQQKLIFTFLKDITDRKKAEIQLAQNEERYRRLFEDANDAILLMEKDRFIECNQRALEMFRANREQIIGSTPYALSPPKQSDGRDSKEKALEMIHSAYEKGKLFFEWKHIRLDGTVFDAEISLSKIVLDDREILQTIIRDVTDRVQAQEQLKKYALSLERMNEEIRQYTNIITHDLRSPLVNMIGFTKELNHQLQAVNQYLSESSQNQQNSPESELYSILNNDIPESLNYIANASIRMNNMIESLLKFSRLGRRELEYQTVDLNQIVKHILDSFNYTIRENKISVQVMQLPVLTTDSFAIQQILGNIIQNAIQYLDPHRPGQISIRAEISDKEITIRIADNGIGISPEDEPNVFAPFRRGRAVKHTKGEGMGLAYVKILVQRLNGSIRFESNPGAGTEFFVTLPIIR